MSITRPAARNIAHDRRRQQRLVRLYVDHDRLWSERQQARGLCQSIRTALVRLRCQQCIDAVRAACGNDVTIVSRHDDARRAAFFRVARDSNHHGYAAEVGQRFVGQPSGSQPRWHDDNEFHANYRPISAGSTLRASDSSITGMPSRIG